MPRVAPVSAAILPLLLLVCSPAYAQWQADCLEVTANGAETNPAVASDGSGGLVVTYGRQVGDDFQIWAQRVDRDGRLLWGAGGVPVCELPGSDQVWPKIAGDRTGGAYIVWSDLRYTDIRTIAAQHLAADGTPTYPADGTPLVTGVNFQIVTFDIVATDAGEALVAWDISFAPVYQVRAQKLSPTGTEWAYGGRIVQSVVASTDNVRIAALADGSAVVAHEHWDEFLIMHSYLHGLDADGNVAWGPNAVRPDADGSTISDLQADPAGGFFLCGYESSAKSGAYLGRYLSHGTEVAVLNTDSYAGDARLTPSEDGVWMAWSGEANDAVVVQAYDRTLAPRFASGARTVCDINAPRTLVDLQPDGEGGALLGWRDMREYPVQKCYVQKVDRDGTPLWRDQGVELRPCERYQHAIHLAADGAGGLVTAFEQEFVSGESQIYAQRIERFGHWGDPAPVIASIADVPADQGGEVLVSWDASRLDDWVESGIERYSVWRALPETQALAQGVCTDWSPRIGGDEKLQGLVRADADGAKTLYWMLLDWVDAYRMPGYAALEPTLADSTAGDPADQLFQVVAHGVASGEMYVSQAFVGRSVDNVAPSAPQGLSGEADFAAGGLDLSWRPVAAPDLERYVVHRGTTPWFLPGRFNLVATTADTALFDASWDHHTAWYYKVAAVDVHGNTGATALLEPDSFSAVGDDAPPQTTRLRPNLPNPFNPSTTIRYESAFAGPVRVQVFDAAGRLVRTLVDGRQSAGSHAVDWNGRDDAGREAASGVYLYRLGTEEGTLTRRMTLLK